MKRLVVAAIAALGSVGAASAADMAVKAPPAPAAYSWTGFYAGANAGYAWGSASDTIAMALPFGFGGTSIVNAANSYRLDGVIGGAQAGYNWQAGSYLYGIEADLQASGQRGSGTIATAILTPFPVFADPTAISETARVDWFGTLRGRLGVTRDHWLFYATGGLAYGGVHVSGVAQPAASVNGLTPPAVWDGSTVRAGWTTGAGVEDAVTAHWSWKVEYLYIDLGHASTTIGGGAALSCIGSPGSCIFTSGPTTGTVNTHVTDNILRGGLNYKF